MLETVGLLNSNSILLYYEAESIKQQIKRVGGRMRRQRLAGQDNMKKNRFVMCNKDQSIVVSVHEYNRSKRMKSSELADERNQS